MANTVGLFGNIDIWQVGSYLVRLFNFFSPIGPENFYLFILASASVCVL